MISGVIIIFSKEWKTEVPLLSNSINSLNETNVEEIKGRYINMGCITIRNYRTFSERISNIEKKKFLTYLILVLLLNCIKL